MYKVLPSWCNQAELTSLKRARGRPPKPVQTTPVQPKRPRGRPPKYILAHVLAAAREREAFTS
jgi:hypothetical protein